VSGTSRNATLDRIRRCVEGGDVRISLHGYDELAADDILMDDVLGGVAAAIVVEDYPDAIRGPTVLLLQEDRGGRPIHVVWGIAKNTAGPAVLITAYRPDPALWSEDFRNRRQP